MASHSYRRYFWSMSPQKVDFLLRLTHPYPPHSMSCLTMCRSEMLRPLCMQSRFPFLLVSAEWKIKHRSNSMCQPIKQLLLFRTVLPMDKDSAIFGNTSIHFFRYLRNTFSTWFGSNTQFCFRFPICYVPADSMQMHFRVVLRGFICFSLINMILEFSWYWVFQEWDTEK